MSKQWFYAANGQQQGPYPEAQFRDLIANGTVRADILVWSEGMAGWQKAAEIPGLAPSAAARPPGLPQGGPPMMAGAAGSPGNPAAMQSLEGAEAQLGGAMGRLFALAEAYPDLKANTTMMQLSEELTSTENKVAFSRQAYNDAVMHYNNLREMFPSNLVAGMFSFEAARLLDIARPEAREAPKVSFG